MPKTFDLLLRTTSPRATQGSAKIFTTLLFRCCHPLNICLHPDIEKHASDRTVYWPYTYPWEDGIKQSTALKACRTTIVIVLLICYAHTDATIDILSEARLLLWATCKCASHIVPMSLEIAAFLPVWNMYIHQYY